MARPRVTPEFIDIEHPALTRAILQQIFDHTHVVDHDDRGWPIVRHEFTCPPWLFDKLAAHGAREEDLEEELVE